MHAIACMVCSHTHVPGHCPAFCVKQFGYHVFQYAFTLPPRPWLLAASGCHSQCWFSFVTAQGSYVSTSCFPTCCSCANLIAVLLQNTLSFHVLLLLFHVSPKMISINYLNVVKPTLSLQTLNLVVPNPKPYLVITNPKPYLVVTNPKPYLVVTNPKPYLVVTNPKPYHVVTNPKPCRHKP